MARCWLRRCRVDPWPSVCRERQRERERVYLASRSLICYFTIIVVFWVLVARSVTMMMKQDDEALKKTNDDGDEGRSRVMAVYLPVICYTMAGESVAFDEELKFAEGENKELRSM